MLATFLTVLKIIGIVLLWIIGIVLGLVLIILFWPYFYKIKGNNEEKTEALINVSFFFHFISFNIKYEEGINVYLKLLGIPIIKKNKNNAPGKSDEIAINNLSEPYESEEVNETKAPDSSKDYETVKESVYDADADSDDTEKSEKKHTKGIKAFFHKKKLNFYDFLINVLEKIRNFLEKPKVFAESIVEKIEYYSHLFNTKGTEYVIQFLKKEIIVILKHLKPYKAKAEIRYGSEDPEKSAKMYETYILLNQYIPMNIDYTPLFEEDEFKFSVNIKGVFNLGYLAFHILRIIMNKKVKKFIKLLKREG